MARNIFPLFFLTFIFAACHTYAAHVCENSEAAKYPFCDTGLPYDVRAKDLVAQMTMEEKAQQMGDRAPGVQRLGLPAYFWWSEALHGVSNVGPGTQFDEVVPGATSFPTVITTAAAFNETLWKTIGQVVSTEARAMHNLGRAGLTYWSPNINLIRDPRWGRTLETPGEDPLLVGRYAVNYVRGLQDLPGAEEAKDPNSRPLKVAACCKHYTAYDLDGWLGLDRTHFNAKVTEQDLMETFNRPFEMCVREGDVSSVMCSFNNVNGMPTCGDPYLLKGKIRGEWNLHGYIVADCDSIDVIVNDQKWLNVDGAQASAQVLRSGIDLDCGIYYPDNLPKAVMQGFVKEEEMDESLKNLYVVLMRLGFFDGVPSLKSLGRADVCEPSNIELAAQAAREGIVLLKNDGTFPLDSNKINSVAVVGPHANATEVMIGNYAGIPCRYVSPLEGISKYADTIFELGCADFWCKDDNFIYPAVKAAKKADATVIVVGLALPIEQEWVDRADLLLPGYQTDLINQVAELAEGPIILVLMSGGVVDISFAKNNSKINAILWAGYPGEEGGRAIADIVFGKFNPSGRLPLTWYENTYIDSLPMTSMQLRPVDSLGYPGRTYRFFNGTTVYPFGHGLSYTKFKYLLSTYEISVNIKLNKFQKCHDLEYTNDVSKPGCPAVLVDDLQCDFKFSFDVTVQNVGEMEGDQVILVYNKFPAGIVGTPIKQLIGFKKAHVAAGASVKVNFEFNVCASLNIVDTAGYNLLPSGTHTIMLGHYSGEVVKVDVKFS